MLPGEMKPAKIDGFLEWAAIPRHHLIFDFGSISIIPVELNKRPVH
jgi:hypothetical protein